jgi:hypothetical protein
LLAAVVLATGMVTAVKRGWLDLTLMFAHAPSMAHPPELLTAVSIVKSRAPKGSLLIYCMDQFEVWGFGLWKRALYPDYYVVGIMDRKFLAGPRFDEVRRRYNIRYILLAGAPLPGTRVVMPLPAGAHAIPVTLVELEN